MRIGIDIQFLRWTPSGIYYYLWNLLCWFCRLEHPHEVSLFLYGRPEMDAPEKLTEVKAAFSAADLRYVWDTLPLVLLSPCFKGHAGRASRCAKAIDGRFLLPLWKRLASADSRLTTWLWNRRAPSRQVDLFHHPAGLLFPLSARANVMTLSDLIPWHFSQAYPWAAEWFGESFHSTKHMDAILTYSEHTKRDAVKTLGVEPDRVHVTPLAAHPQYRPVEDRDHVRSVLAKHQLLGRPYILTIGTIEPRKNQLRLLEAFHLLRQRDRGLEHRLILVGSAGAPEHNEALLGTIQRLGLGGDARWLGYAAFEDLPALYTGADLFVFPSWYEGFGLPPLEAMSCGTPVVAANASSLPEVVGDAGLLADPYQVEDLTEAMQRALTDRGLRAVLRENGLRRAALYSWETTARRTLAAYEEAWQRSRDRRGNGRPRKPARTRNLQEMRTGFIDTLYHEAAQSVYA